MRWTPENVAWHCLRAGWPRRQVPDAVGRAWTVSELDDAYQYPDPPAVHQSYTGLWGFDTKGWPADERAVLTRLDVACDYALELWDAADEAWDWCPDRTDYQRGFWAATLGDVVANATPDRDITGRVSGPVIPRTLQAFAAQMRRQLGRVPPDNLRGLL